jgi:hypothetical protein
LRFDLKNLYFEVNPQRICGKGWREFEGQTSHKPRIDLQIRYFYFPVSGYRDIGPTWPESIDLPREYMKKRVYRANQK